MEKLNISSFTVTERKWNNFIFWLFFFGGQKEFVCKEKTFVKSYSRQQAVLCKRGWSAKSEHWCMFQQ